MSKMPQPPMTNRARAREMPQSPEPDITKPGRLTENEWTHILRATLLPEHHSDPNVIRFISSYIRCRDSRQAAQEAGITARSGVNLRGRPDIHEAITKITEKSVMKYGFDASEVIEKVKEIAAIDPVEFENEDGSFKTHMRDIAPESRRAIKKFKAKNLYETDPNGMRVCVGQLIEVELWDKLKAVELLGREKDIFKETRKVEHDVTERMADVLLDSSRRADERVVDITHSATPTTPKQLSPATTTNNSPSDNEISIDDG